MADNLEKINCPACGRVMKKIFLPQVGVNIDICADGCGGLFFDNKECEKVNEQSEDVSKIIEILKDKKFKKTDETEIRICPVCGNNMVKNFASPKRQVVVDDCYICGGKFLDYGELEKIRAEYNSNVGKVINGEENSYNKYIYQNSELDPEFDASYKKVLTFIYIVERILSLM